MTVGLQVGDEMRKTIIALALTASLAGPALAQPRETVDRRVDRGALDSVERTVTDVSLRAEDLAARGAAPPPASPAR